MSLRMEKYKNPFLAIKKIKNRIRNRNLKEVYHKPLHLLKILNCNKII
jgi:hypothetical protein